MSSAAGADVECGWTVECLCPGTYLGYRLLSVGCDTVFCVPGDFNLPVLDALAQVPGLRVVNCNSELAAAYAADGYARARLHSLGCCVTTVLVGALSAINGVAGSFAEELAVLHIVGVPATWQYSGVCTLHHTLGNAEDMGQEREIYRPVTCYQTMLRSFHDARYLVDKALTKCLQNRKPVLMEVCRDLPMVPHPSLGRPPPFMTPFGISRSASDPTCLHAAVAAAKAFFADKQMPLLVLGRRARYCQQSIIKLADSLRWGVLVLHDAKGMFPETHPSFVGVYSHFYTSPASVKQCFEAADALLCIGVHWNEMSTGAPPDQALELRSVLTYKSHVLVGHTEAFSGVTTEDFLQAMTGCLQPNSAAVQLFHSLPATAPLVIHDPQFTAAPEVPLKMDFVMQQIQTQLLGGDADMGVLVDTGDSMFRTQTFKLPAGTPYEVQMFAANIGWAAPAGLGFALGTKRRMLVIGGDGGLQMTSGSIGDYVKCGSNAIWVCVNNDGYLIERYLSPIPEASYNYVQRWDYSMLAQAMCGRGGKFKVFKVASEAEVVSALREAKQLSNHFIFIEVLVDKRDAAPAAAALRQAFMARHVSSVAGYRHLNLGASLAHGSSLSSFIATGVTCMYVCSSLTAGHDGCVSAGTEVGGHGAGQGANPAPSGATGGADTGLGGGAGSGHAGRLLLKPGAHTRALGGTEGAQSRLGLGLGCAQGPELEVKVKGSLHPAAGSSTCLASEGEGGSSQGASRLGLVPAKRPAEGEAGDSD